VQATRRSR